MYPDDFLQKKLQERRDEGSLRALRSPADLVDFCSNDYLGIVKNHRLHTTDKSLSAGSTGSRLISGNYLLIEETERMIAAFHGADAALLFNSGYDANIGLLASVPQKGDTIFYDQLSHASIRDGIRLSFATSFAFAHNDIVDLEKKMSNASGNIFIVTESVFSMDGDMCPLPGLVSIAQQYNAHLIIDEAHATGVIGTRGEGLVQLEQLQEKIFARMHTFGKACGSHGAVVLGSQTLRNYLVNFARSFVYTTALPEHATAMIKAGYELFPNMTAEREQLARLIRRFQDAEIAYEKLVSSSPIQAVILPGNEKVKALASAITAQGLDVRPILYPSVPRGKERLRVVLHAFNSMEELEQLIRLLQ
jgi:8-amino-7-oxononanoate synthase